MLRDPASQEWTWGRDETPFCGDVRAAEFFYLHPVDPSSNRIELGVVVEDEPGGQGSLLKLSFDAATLRQVVAGPLHRCLKPTDADAGQSCLIQSLSDGGKPTDDVSTPIPLA